MASNYNSNDMPGTSSSSPHPVEGEEMERRGRESSLAEPTENRDEEDPSEESYIFRLQAMQEKCQKYLQDIDQLESDLSRIKARISDLNSSLTENLEHYQRTIAEMQSNRPVESRNQAVAEGQRHGGLGSEKDNLEQLRQAYAVQDRALRDEHRRQQEELEQLRQAHAAQDRALRYEHGRKLEELEQLRQAHAQDRALRDEHRRQQEELEQLRHAHVAQDRALRDAHRRQQEELEQLRQAHAAQDRALRYEHRRKLEELEQLRQAHAQDRALRDEHRRQLEELEQLRQAHAVQDRALRCEHRRQQEELEQLRQAHAQDRALRDEHRRQLEKLEQLRHAHAQDRALRDEHRRQQEELKQLRHAHAAEDRALRYEHRRKLEELLQSHSPLLERSYSLVNAVVRGFLDRRLLKTERVAKLVRTISDTNHFLEALKEECSSGRVEFSLKQIAIRQLRIDRYKLHDIFFSLTVGDRMQLIHEERELSGHTVNPRGRTSLSQRKRGKMIQKKAAERHRGVVKRTGHNTGSTAKQPLGTKRGQH